MRVYAGVGGEGGGGCQQPRMEGWDLGETSTGWRLPKSSGIYHSRLQPTVLADQSH